jgi:hypothetical protein
VGNKELKIVIGEETVAAINCSKDGCKIDITEEGKEICKNWKGCCE